jgi:GMP synthase (glutamine-hydrolysing)
MRVAIIENTLNTQHGQMGVALHEAGAAIDLYKPWADGRLPEPGSYDALVVFGGPQNARADAEFPYLPALAKLMAQDARSGKAVMGICLGAQILARGAGAESLIGKTREMGWCAVDLCEEGRVDPVLGALPERFEIFEWHSDTFTLPDGALHLASSPVAPIQSFRIGRAGYATQFHFEANRNVVQAWASGNAALMERENPGFIAGLPSAATDQGLRADSNGLAIARAWVTLI